MLNRDKYAFENPSYVMNIIENEMLIVFGW